MQRFSQLPPLGLYIHIPWCIKKCPYCDFNSHTLRNTLPEKTYIAALKQDLDVYTDTLQTRQIQTVFFGGGTPSLFSADSIADILDHVGQYQLDTSAEVTLEANPGTIEQQQFSDFRSAGVNRLSIGVQTFDDALLPRLGRIHNGHEAIKAVESAQQAGFDNFNLDLMFGLPGQSRQQAENDIQTAIALQPAHISHYQLTIEPETAFYKQPPVLPDSDRIWEIQQHCQQQLADNGFMQYEISAYAKPDKQCLHNLNYWRFGDYIGIGAGAHGKLTKPNHILRQSKLKAPLRYMENAGTVDCEDENRFLSDEDIVFEFLLNNLRLNNGFTTQDFEQRTGLAMTALPLQDMVNKGWLQQQNATIQTTKTGQLYLNDLLTSLLPD